MRLFRALVKWVGLATMLFGGGSVVWALVAIIQYKTGWGVNDLDLQDPDRFARVALSLLLSGMFFFLVGSGAVLIARYEGRSSSPDNRPPRWTKPVTILLFVSGFGSIGLATLFAGMTEEFGDATVGIVSYCMLIGVGLLFSGWGLKRAGDRDEGSASSGS